VREVRRFRDRHPGRRRHSVWSALVPLTALVAGILFAATATTARGVDLRPGNQVQIRDLVVAQQRRIAATNAEVRALRQQVNTDTQAAASRDSTAASARDTAAALAPAAGLTPVTGPAVTVALDDAPRLPGGVLPGKATPDDLVVHQQDVQAVVNALWVGGAEAMTLMGQRVIATSAVRCVGNTLLLHGAVYSPPFTITAVGDVEAMRTALDRAPAVALFRQYVAAYGLGYTVTTAKSRTLPAYDGAVELGSGRAG
jgi:uncharacterized protein YlxW (UPF0749 family)